MERDRNSMCKDHVRVEEFVSPRDKEGTGVSGGNRPKTAPSNKNIMRVRHVMSNF